MDVSVRRLKDRLSEYLRIVQQGEKVTVTDHGRPVATLSPITASHLSPARRLAAMVASGEVTEPLRRPFRKVTPSKVKGPPMSRTIIEDRR